MIAAARRKLRPLYRKHLKGVANYVYDFRRFARSYNAHSALTAMDREQAITHLLRTMHSLEKGLALPVPKPGFGYQKAVVLQHEAQAYQTRFGRDEIYRDCMAVLADYTDYQARNGRILEDFDLDTLRREAGGVHAGAREVSRDEIWQASRIDFAAFAKSRSSVRMFSDAPVRRDDILAAIEIAGKSPSVCNRGVGRAYYTTDPRTITALLAHQNGNLGYGDSAGAVIVVAADMRAFYKPGERNQGWIDGGLFAMSLNFALHALGYGVCMLNWSMEAAEDRAFRAQFGIPDAHLVVMLMAVGNIPETLRVAVSPRREIGQYAFSLDGDEPSAGPPPAREEAQVEPARCETENAAP